jgi:hypothetical protein
MLGWDSGYVDYATTIYWYGDYESKGDEYPEDVAEADHFVTSSVKTLKDD